MFFQEGYFDCELALRFGYPMRKRNKLLERKFHLAFPNETKITETLQEIDEMVKRKLFTEQQMKCNNQYFR